MLEVIILAAGQGSRMQSRLPKVLHLLSGRPLIHYTLDAARAAGANHIHVVVGCGADAVEAAVQAPDVQCHSAGSTKRHGPRSAASNRCVPSQTQRCLCCLVMSRWSVTRRCRRWWPPLRAALPCYQPRWRTRQGMVGLFAMTKATFWRWWNTKTHRLAQHQLREINTGVLASRAGLLKDWLSRSPE